jgi:hypothetical protein
MRFRLEAFEVSQITLLKAASRRPVSTECQKNSFLTYSSDFFKSDEAKWDAGIVPIRDSSQFNYD